MVVKVPTGLSDTVENEIIKPEELQPQRRMHATVVVVQGSEADLGAQARIERRVVIGRDPAADLSLSDARASKHHAAIEPVATPQGTRYEVRDLGSTNGTLVNGQNVLGPRQLEDGDKIGVASSLLRFSLADEVDAAFQAQVDAMLSTDDLTGLLAHRRFEAALEEALRAASLQGSTLALLVFDIDDLKQINDTHGHATGAYTIGEVGRLLAQVVSNRGTATRFGGDEFVAFLPGASCATAVAVGEELRERCAAHRFERDGVVVKPTVSAGVCVFPDGAKTTKALFDAADRALYRAKSKGKDRVAT